MSPLDPETNALTSVMQQLEPLESDARMRIIKYALERYGRSDSSIRMPLSVPIAATPYTSGNAMPMPIAPVNRSSENGLDGSQLSSEVDITALANAIKDPSIYSIIEQRIFHQRNRLNRILITLYAYELAGYDGDGLTSGEITKFFGQLKIKVHQPDISNALAEQARQYVYPAGQRKPGKGVRYRLSPIGRTHIGNVLAGAE
ncbi:MAG TPA: hypothetical protein V6C97_01865 [Oculatellaceae cyanobacterium]